MLLIEKHCYIQMLPSQQERVRYLCLDPYIRSVNRSVLRSTNKAISLCMQEKEMPHPQTTTTATVTAAATTRQCRSSCGCIRRLMRKLKKHSNRILCMATGSVAAFDCHYDPLSYARNFDHDDGSSHSLYVFSSRFAAVAKPPLVQGNNVVTR